VFREQGDQEDRVKIGEVIADNDRGADRGYGILNADFKPGNQGPNKAKKTSVIEVIQPLKGDLTIGRKNECSEIQWRKKQQKTGDIIYPDNQRDQKVNNAFKKVHPDRHLGAIQTSLLTGWY
jgi:hypothetical protein